MEKLKIITTIELNIHTPKEHGIWNQQEGLVLLYCSFLFNNFFFLFFPFSSVLGLFLFFSFLFFLIIIFNYQLLFTSSFFFFFLVSLHVLLVITGRIYSYPYVKIGFLGFFLKKDLEKWMVGRKEKATRTLI